VKLVKIATSASRTRSTIGLHWLMEEMNLRTPAPFVRSESVSGARKTYQSPAGTIELYPASYAPRDIWGHLRFALRYEPVDLGVLAAFFSAVNPPELQQWIQTASTGVFARRAWYLFEMLTGRHLDMPDVAPTGYAPLLNPEMHVTTTGFRVQRQRILDNLLGNNEYCPLIRRTSGLDGWMAQDFGQMFQEQVIGVKPGVVHRATQYLFTKETKSSFAIEGETPAADKASRFVRALQHIADFDTTKKDSFVELQRLIVDGRYAIDNWRSLPVWVGTTVSSDMEVVHLVGPKPEDLPSLMDGWMRAVARTLNGEVNAVCVAAIAGFGFVYLHPFEDGNGRIHRFLIHYALAKVGFTPPGVVFPVSAYMLRNAKVYDQALEFLSNKINALVDFRIDYGTDGVPRIHISGETASLYRFPDLTFQAEYLYRAVDDTIRTDMKMELAFLASYDRAMAAAKEIVDMPDLRASLLVRLILQNHGHLSTRKRKQFSELRDEEIERIERAIAEASAVREVGK